MEKGPIGTRRMEKGTSGNFYDELQASWMSNCRSHRYTSDVRWRKYRVEIYDEAPFVIDQIMFITDV